MKVEVNTIEGSAVKLDIAIPADAARQEFNKACKRIGQRVNVPGFRRGKAPLRMIEKNVGTDAIKQEALDRYLPYIFADVISEKKLDVVAPPRILSLSFELEEGINLIAEVDIRPEVKLPELRFELDVEEPQQVEGAVEKELNAMLERAAKLETIEGRDTIEDKDVLEMDFDGTLNGEEIPGGKAEKFVLDLSNNHFIDNFTDQLPGKKVGEAFSIDVLFPEDYFDESLAGQTVQFDILVHAIKEYRTPELNDETAKEMGPYESAKDLQEHVAKQVQQRQEQEKNYRAQRALVEALIEKTEIDIPKGLIQREIESLTRELAERLKQQGMSFEEFQRANGAGMETEFRNEAIGRIKTSLTFAEISKQENIRISDEEFNKEVSQMAQNMNMDEKTVVKRLAEQPQAIQALTDQLLAQKIVSILLERSEVRWNTPEAKDDKATKPKKASKPKAKAKPKAEDATEDEEISEEVTASAQAE